MESAINRIKKVVDKTRETLGTIDRVKKVEKIIRKPNRQSNHPRS